MSSLIALKRLKAMALLHMANKEFCVNTLCLAGRSRKDKPVRRYAALTPALPECLAEGRPRLQKQGLCALWEAG